MQVEYKEKLIGEIPNDWGVVRLGDIVEINEESQDPTKAIPDDKFFYVDIESIEGGTGFIKTAKEIFGKDAPSRARRVIRQNDVIMSTVRPYLKAFAIVTKKYDNQICSTGFAVLSCKKEILPHYLLYTLFSKAIIEQCSRIMVGGQYPALNQSQVKNLKLPLPPLPEQRRIAEILTTADTTIQKVDDAIAKTERLKRGLMQELLTKGIGHEEFKDSEVGRIPREWQVTTLRAECVVGTGGTPSRKQPEYFGGTIPWIKTTEVNYNTIVETGECITKLGLQNSNAKIYLAGTLIIAMYGQGVTRGKCAILGMDAAINQACAAVTPKNDNNIHVKYLQYWCQFKYDQIRNLRQGANQSNLNLSIVGSMRFPLPSFPEQHHIAEILSTVDKKLELERKRKEKLERVKKGLMNELLTGKKRVTIAR